MHLKNRNLLRQVNADGLSYFRRFRKASFVVIDPCSFASAVEDWPAWLADTQGLLLSHTDQFTPDLHAEDCAFQLEGQQSTNHV